MAPHLLFALRRMDGIFARVVLNPTGEFDSTGEFQTYRRISMRGRLRARLNARPAVSLRDVLPPKNLNVTDSARQARWLETLEGRVLLSAVAPAATVVPA